MPGRRVSMPKRAAPVDLSGVSMRFDLLADQLELVGRLDRRLRGERDFGGVRGKLAESR